MNCKEINSFYPVIKFSICTLVSNFEQYNEMRKSFSCNGFLDEDCEFLFVNNRFSNKLDAYEAINLFLSIAQGRYIIICHQDVILHTDDRAVLLERIAELERCDPNWGLLGNAGGRNFNEYSIRISDPHGTDIRRGGPFPAPVMSLDENFILVRASANLTVSRDIGGFHLYGTDLCLIASILGYSAYVIDFHLKHYSGGDSGSKTDTHFHSFTQSRRRFIAKYQRALAPRWLNTTCTRMYLSGNRLRNAICNLRMVIRMKRKFDKFIHCGQRRESQ